MSDNRRVQRTAALMLAELSRVLWGEVSDPALKGIFLHEVELSKDLKHAKVYFSYALDGTGASSEPTPAQVQAVDRGFQRAQAFFKKKLADNLKLRYVPTLEFKRDVHAESVTRLYDLFSEVNHEVRES